MTFGRDEDWTGKPSPWMENLKGRKEKMTLDTYQVKAQETVIYPAEAKVVYPAFGLAGEAGEVVNKVKKLIRDYSFLTTPSHPEVIPPHLWTELQHELGDVLWYLSALASDLGMSLDTIARVNLAMLAKRKKEDKLKGEGDER